MPNVVMDVRESFRAKDNTHVWFLGIALWVLRAFELKIEKIEKQKSLAYILYGQSYLPCRRCVTKRSWSYGS